MPPSDDLYEYRVSADCHTGACNVCDNGKCECPCHGEYRPAPDKCVTFILCDQGSEAWHTVRKGRPTASKFSEIMTPAKCQKSKSLEGYICELIGNLYSLIPPEFSENYTNKAIRFGQATEAEARRYYEMERGLQVEQIGFAISECKSWGCSPDGLVGEDGALELKCPQGKTQVEYLRKGGLPLEYKCQVHGEMIVTGRAWCDFMSFSPGLPELLIRVERDEFTAKLEAALVEFAQVYAEALKQFREMTEVAV